MRKLVADVNFVVHLHNFDGKSQEMFRNSQNMERQP